MKSSTLVLDKWLCYHISQVLYSTCIGEIKQSLVADLLEVSLVEGAHSNVISESKVAWVQLEGTLKTVLSQLPSTQKHIHQPPVRERRHAGEPPWESVYM